MNPLDKQITFAIKTLIRRNDGEFHGHWPAIAEKIAYEVSGLDDDLKLYENHLRNMGLKYFFEDHPDVYFCRGMTGELNFIDRKLVYTACECTVHKQPGCAPVIEVHHAE